MAKFRAPQSWFVMLAVVFALAGKSYAQSRLPGGITSNDPRQPAYLGTAPARPEHPDPDWVRPGMVEMLGGYLDEFGNGCDSKAVAQIQDNITRFANGDDPVHIAVFRADTVGVTRAQELDARSLADDLIRANAAGWLLTITPGLMKCQWTEILIPKGGCATFTQPTIRRE